jgi:hypothetical protein
MSTIRKLNMVLFVICVMSASMQVVVNAEEEKPKTEAKPPAKPPAEVKDLELSGVVTKMEVKEGKPPAYQLKQDNGILVVLPSKIGAEDAKLDQYVDKSVVVKGKGSTYEKKKANGENYTAIRLVKLVSVEVKPAAVEEKPAEKPAEKAEDKKEEGMK